MMALGSSPLASIALPCLGYDPLTSFSLLAVPITAPVQAFVPAADYNHYVNILANNVALFLPIISTGLAIGMLWIADGMNGVKEGIVPAVVAGLTLGLSAIVFVKLFPDLVVITGVVAGLMAILSLVVLRVIQGKPLRIKKGSKSTLGRHRWRSTGPAIVESRISLGVTGNILYYYQLAIRIHMAIECHGHQQWGPHPGGPVREPQAAQPGIRVGPCEHHHIGTSSDS